jgi:spore coat protein U-like protein
MKLRNLRREKMLKLTSKVFVGALVAAGLASMSGMAMATGATSGTMVVSATLTDACEVATGAAIAFGSFAGLASSGDKVADSGATFQIACSKGAVPTIKSTTGNTMSDGGGTPRLLPFNLSLTSGASADNMPTTAAAITITQDGTMQTVPLYARVLVANFTGANALAAGTFTKTVTVDVGY